MLDATRSSFARSTVWKSRALSTGRTRNERETLQGQLQWDSPQAVPLLWLRCNPDGLRSKAIGESLLRIRRGGRGDVRDGQSLQHGGQGLLLEHHQRHLPARRLQSDADVNQSPPNAGTPSTSRARRDMVDKPREK